MKYLNATFSTPANSRAYVDGWERCFGEGPTKLERWLELEREWAREMRRPQAAQDPVSDALGDAMDALWYELSVEDLAWLDARGNCSDLFGTE